MQVMRWHNASLRIVRPLCHLSLSFLTDELYVRAVYGDLSYLTAFCVIMTLLKPGFQVGQQFDSPDG